MGTLELLLILTILAVVVFLGAGLVSFAADDQVSRDRSNLLMRLRVGAQGVAIILLALLVYFSRG
jgi:hypothetical protein